MGIMMSIAGGELVMITAAVVLIRDAIDWRIAFDAIRGLVAGGATVLLVPALPIGGPSTAIPAAVVIFLACSIAVGLIRPSDVQQLAGAFPRADRIQPARASRTDGRESAGSSAVSAAADRVSGGLT